MDNSEQKVIFEGSPISESLHNKVEISPEIQSVVDKYNDLRDEVKESKKEFLLIFGIFASFVTFLSVEIQIFKTVTDFWLLLGLSSFLLSAILLFTLVINNIVKDKNKLKDFIGPVFILLFFFLLISVIFFFIYFYGIENSNNSFLSNVYYIK